MIGCIVGVGFASSQEELNDYMASLPDEDLERIWAAMWHCSATQEWEEQAREGLPTSACAPKGSDVETPPKVSVLGFDVPEDTPEKVLQPYKKAQLIAQKKLEQQVKMLKRKVAKQPSRGWWQRERSQGRNQARSQPPNPKCLQTKNSDARRPRVPRALCERLLHSL